MGILHIAYHFIVPAMIVALFFRADWKRAYLFLMLTMLVDLDHLLANPIYDASRCSIGFHPLHRFHAIAVYVVLCFIPRPLYFRYVGIGLVIHMVLDSLDCQTTSNSEHRITQ